MYLNSEGVDFSASLAYRQGYDVEDNPFRVGTAQHENWEREFLEEQSHDLSDVIECDEFGWDWVF